MCVYTANMLGIPVCILLSTPLSFIHNGSCKHNTHVFVMSFVVLNVYRLPDSMTALVNLHTLLLNDICLESLPVNFGRLVYVYIIFK